MDDRGLRFMARADVLEGRCVDPCTAAAGALEHRRVAEGDFRHVRATGGARRFDRRTVGPGPARAARGTVRGSLEHQRETFRTADGREDRMAVAAGGLIRPRRTPAIRAVQRACVRHAGSIAEHELQTVDRRPPTADRELQTGNCKLPTYLGSNFSAAPLIQ